ncbi:hypothetical protein [Fibrella aquatilis]|uniref:DUF3052 domain-containing protein n=1 Tax=Fibrella aquatilis TaxID=2817059 RepID=A0A939G3I0_9BACT|nr:hypothetical protein [Fibrella aquatilis]MBO0931384.1 hypothetical protein [Fibrella aquatilis]
MEALVKKLNYVSQPTVVLLNVPAELGVLSETFSRQSTVYQQVEHADRADFLLAFVQQLGAVKQVADWVAAHTVGDVTIWLAYPKQTSKTYRCDFNRDTGWAALGAIGFEPVRQVAVNDDWSALRFRRVAYIKTMSRSHEGAISAEGKLKTSPTSVS